MRDATKQWTPAQIPESFWRAVAAADGERDRYVALLEQKSRTALYDFHALYDRAASCFTGVPYADPNGSEDDLFDTANWIVAPGEEFRFDILGHPEKTPRERSKPRRRLLRRHRFKRTTSASVKSSTCRSSLVGGYSEGDAAREVMRRSGPDLRRTSRRVR